MSKLYHDESGRVVPTLCEELSRYRRARKLLVLPATSQPASLYFLARAYPENDLSLRVSVNGVELAPVAPRQAERYGWYHLTLPPGTLRAGANQVEFWTDASALAAWSLAIEAGHAEPLSQLSDDGGGHWRSERMGYLNVLRGEYVVRLRLAEGRDPDPPGLVWEDPTHPRLEALRRMLPAAAVQPGPALARVRALATWLSSSWEHTSTDRAALYAPWDAETILAWARNRRGHAGQTPIAYCVHYAAAGISCCQALGIPARGAVLLDSMNGVDGHFVLEVWLAEFSKWAMLDPNLDAMFWEAGVPLSLPEIRQLGAALETRVVWGPGLDFQRQNPRIVQWIEHTYLTGLCFRHRGLWPRADLLSRPDLSPPGHGSLAYCETDIVWEEPALAAGFGMFPYFGDASYFDAPPALVAVPPATREEEPWASK
jgi:hypothetical protein